MDDWDWTDVGAFLACCAMLGVGFGIWLAGFVQWLAELG